MTCLLTVIPQRWQVLAQVAACDLNWSKFFESHLDALAILAELGVDDIAEGPWQWAAEGGDEPLRFDGETCTGQNCGVRVFCRSWFAILPKCPK